MDRKKDKGFTLVELMIVVAVIGIISALALPAFSSYTIRSQVSEGPILAANLKIQLVDYFNMRGHWPVDHTLTGAGISSGNYVSSVTSSSGTIIVTYGNKASANILNATLHLTAQESANNDIFWECSAGTISQQYIPTTCK